MTSSDRFYEDYWSDPRAAPPESDPDRHVRLEWALQWLSSHDGREVIDIGCGSGFTALGLASRGYQVLGMDISARALEVMQASAPKVKAIQHAVENVPWPVAQDTFDAAVCFEVAEHVIDPARLFGEICRVLRPGGSLLLTTPYHGLVKNLALVLLSFDNHFNNIRGGHIRFYSVRALHKQLEAAGLEVIQIKLYGRLRPFARGIFCIARKPSGDGQ